MDRPLNDAIEVRAPARVGERYVRALCFGLAGYATLGKGFALLGVPPLYVGELLLLAGLVTVFRLGGLTALIASWPGLLLAANIVWTLIRTLPGVQQYGIDAPRDSVIITYGFFAFFVIALLLDDQARLHWILARYRDFLVWFVPVIPFLFALCHMGRDIIPRLPGTDVPLVMLGPGEVPVHMAGAAVFAMAGFFKPSKLWIAGLVAATALSSAVTRGGMLAFAVPVLSAALVLGKIRTVLIFILLGGGVLFAAYGFETVTGDSIPLTGAEGRQFSATQVVRNIGSIFGDNDPVLEGTKTWRLEWWGKIIDDTVHGDNFWTGRGYGVNLAMAFGYGDPRDEAPLRSPHNAAFTILGRGGVPGLALWLAFLATWAASVGSAMLAALRRGAREWARVFLWIGCYATAIVTNALFDVALEGPMQGIWFWCVIGLGIGAVMAFRFQLGQHDAASRRSAS